MTVISTDGNGTDQIGQNVAGQLATSRQIIKDLVGVDIAELISGRVTGAAAGEAFANAESAPKPRRQATPPATPKA